MISKKDLTELFLKEAGISVQTDKGLREWVWNIWHNPLSQTSYRLTKLGNVFLTEQVKLQSYKLKLTTDIKSSSKNLIMLDKYLTSPFYIENKNTIIFYGEKDSIMVVLNGYNLQQYLENFER